MKPKPSKIKESKLQLTLKEVYKHSVEVIFERSRKLFV
jgi:hypothetical protein